MNDMSGLGELSREALRWLVSIYDPVAGGWGWLAHIPPNEQNTAEVIVALAKHAHDIEPYREILLESVERQLLNSQAAVTKDWIWVAYALITVKNAGLYPDEVALDKSITAALHEVENLWDTREGGWPDCAGEPCQTTWTALSLILLHEYLPPPMVGRALRFLARAQNGDGGWGLWKISEAEIEERFRSHPRLIARASSQIASNAASTALATLALTLTKSAPGRAEEGVRWLLSHAMDTGGWAVFQQIGVRLGETFTYRHFSTVWAIRALLAVDQGNIYNETVIAGVMYLIRLQDIATNGWRSAEDADPFTWATCNALDAMADVSRCLLVRTTSMFSIISEWHQTRHLREIGTVDALGTRFVFNRQAALAASLSITVMAAFGIVILAWSPKPLQLAGAGVLSLATGIPWVILRRGILKRELSEAVIFVYTIIGVITGVLLTIGATVKI
jgi:hypothetical protein